MREDSLRGVTSNPAIFEKAILGSDDYDERDRASSPSKGLSAPRRSTSEIAIKDVQLACDVLRPRLGRGRRRRRLRLARGRARRRARHRRHARAGARLLGARRPPQRDDQDPGHRRGLPAIEEAIADGHQRQRHAAVLGRGLRRAIAEAYIRGLERRLEAGESIDVHSVASFFVSRVDTEVDKRLEQLGQRGPAGHRRGGQRARRLREVQGALPGRALREAARGRLPGAAPAVGLDRREEPALPRDEVRGRRWSRRTRSTRCRCPRCSPCARAARGRRARPPTRTRAPTSQRSPTPASTWTT